MDGTLNKKQAKWWCIHFGQQKMDVLAARKLQSFFRKITPHVVFGNQKVFLDVSQCKWKKALYPFQMKLTSIAKALHLEPEFWQWGVGASMAESWVMARWRTLSAEELPVEAITDFINPLELDRNRVNEKHRLRLLRSLGASTLQDLIEIPEDDLLAQCGVWITDFVREHFAQTETLREHWLEKSTAASFHEYFAESLPQRSFQLEDWVPEEYLSVA